MKESGLGPGSGPSLAHSPSFNGHSSGTLAEIAARVVSEFAHYHHHNDVVSYSSTTNDAFPQPESHHLLHRNGIFGFEIKPQSLESQQENDVVDYYSDFEFAFPGIGENPSPISADEIFLNGQIRPLFPPLNTGLVLPQPHSPAPDENRNPKSPARNPIRMPLKKLMISERETSLTESFSCSSSETDELEGVAPGTYCVWNPNKNEMKKKNKSAGSSKRWNFRDLLYRSHSYRGDDLVVLASKSKNDIKKPQAKSAERNSSGDGRKKKKKANGESDRNRRTAYLVGMLANMNGLSRAVKPF